MDGKEEMNSERCLRYLGWEDGMKRGGKVQVHWLNDMLEWLVAGFVPMSSQSKEEAVCVAVGSCRCYRHRTAACEGILGALGSN